MFSYLRFICWSFASLPLFMLSVSVDTLKIFVFFLGKLLQIWTRVLPLRWNSQTLQSKPHLHLLIKPNKSLLLAVNTCALSMVSIWHKEKYCYIEFWIIHGSTDRNRSENNNWNKMVYMEKKVVKPFHPL